MKVLRIAATALLSVLLLGAGLAAQALGLMRTTVLEPDFYGENARQVYNLIGRTVVHKMADVVLECAPAIVLRTRDREEALALAEQALPPEQVAQMLENSGPAIARYVFYGGDIPVLRDSPEFMRGEIAVVKGLLLDGVWDMLPEKPAFPAFMPFTPEWNLGYGQSLPDQLWLTRHYAGMADYAVWLAVSAVVILAGLICLMWIRERKLFYTTMSALMIVNGLIVLALAAAASYWAADVAGGMANLYPASLAAGLFAQDWTELVRAAVRPFRDIFALWSGVCFSLGIALATMGVERNATAWPWNAERITAESGAKPAGRRGPRHARPG